MVLIKSRTQITVISVDFTKFKQGTHNNLGGVVTEYKMEDIYALP